MPPLNPQFFYASQIGIDDPLSAVPIPGAKSKTTDHLPRPFSAYDNSALEEAWMSFSRAGKRHKKKRKGTQDDLHNSPFTNLAFMELSSEEIHEASTQELLKAEDLKPSANTPSTAEPGCCPPPIESAEFQKPHLNNPFGFFKRVISKEHPEDGKPEDLSSSQLPGNKGNPYNKRCNDEHHIGMDNKLGCCDEFEAGDSGHEHHKLKPDEIKDTRRRTFRLTNTDTGAPNIANDDQHEGEKKGRHHKSKSPKGKKTGQKGNPYNKLCDDEHHLGMDNKPDCCDDFEVDGSGHKFCKTKSDKTKNNHPEGEGASPTSKSKKADKPASKDKGVLFHDDADSSDKEDLATDKKPSPKDEAEHHKQTTLKYNPYGHDLADCQADGARDGSSSPINQDGQASEGCQDYDEHKAIDKHKRCKSHQAFEAHLAKHNKPESEHGGKENKPENPEGHHEKHAERHRKRAEKHEKHEKHAEKHEKRSRSRSPKNLKSSENIGQAEPAVQLNSQLADVYAPNEEATTTRRPFLRLPSRKTKTEPQPQGEVSSPEENSAKEQDGQDEEMMDIPGCKAQKSTKEQIDVPVGASRLHHVQLPSLQMKPIYWSPVHDIAVVTRGTWFYKDTMYPVEPADANQLEMGYRELRPWSQTWKDEVNSAMEVGAEAEEKIAHQLWPKENEQKYSSRKKLPHTLSTDPYCAAKCFNGEAAAEGASDFNGTESKQPTNLKTITKKFPSSQVFYKNARNAFILKPTLQPSTYYGRKPLQKIMKGQTIGIHVVRGFDWKLWEKLHPSKKSHRAAKAEYAAPTAVGNGASNPSECSACKHEEQRPEVTDVIFVIHGIGQKLSERMESFHFTHAINSFRREVNLEMTHDGVQQVLRKDLGGVMVLPINWRTNLSFEDGGPMKEEDRKTNGYFTLDDITPTTIPAVRNIISDVMLDIPFYMSHHKPKMIQAVIAEANRVHRLWCRNNPDFVKNGRVHIIAHSLGSAMALDILSKQPTSVPHLNPAHKKSNTKHLDFNTTNLFLAGSPAGFFLLLEKAMLLPRKSQSKADAEQGDDSDPSLTGNAGTFGCLAVDNIYNIMHYNDPIAYRMNAAVDPQYAASLKNAQVPNATTGFFESIGNMIYSKKGGDITIDVASMKPQVKRLPSQLEMAVHDFTREEIAEKKLALLNDNGQIDWFLSSGGGPLEIQYINMLGAHSSYWLSHDFVRFIVVEVGRKPGKGHALPHMKAQKIGHQKSGSKS